MYIDVNQNKLYYEKTGHGTPILLLHGNGEDHTIFDVLISMLKPHYTVYAIDSRGHGASSPTDSYHYEDMANDIAELIIDLKIKSPVLYGFSDGGIIGLLIALHYPGILSSLIISGANLNPQGMKEEFLEKIKQHFEKTNSPLERLMMEEPNILPSELKQLQIPVLVLAGEHDIIDPAHTKLIAESIPHAQLKILPGEDHRSYIIHSDKLYSYIRDFICNVKYSDIIG